MPKYNLNYGANVRIAKMMYLAYRGSLINHHVTALILHNSKGIERLDKMQNEAL